MTDLQNDQVPKLIEKPKWQDHYVDREVFQMTFTIMTRVQMTPDGQVIRLP